MNTKDVIGMTVEECVNKLPFNVKLGSEKGSAFVFCGDLAKLDADALDRSVCDLYKRTAEHSEYVIEGLLAKKMSYKVFVKEVEEKREKRAKKMLGDSSRKLVEEEVAELDATFDTSKDAYKKWHAGQKRKLDSARTTLRTALKKLESYTTIRDRKIVDCYWSIDEDNTLILIYDGSERGYVWTTAEFCNGGELEDA